MPAVPGRMQRPLPGSCREPLQVGGSSIYLLAKRVLRGGCDSQKGGVPHAWEAVLALLVSLAIHLLYMLTRGTYMGTLPSSKVRLEYLTI